MGSKVLVPAPLLIRVPLLVKMTFTHQHYWYFFMINEKPMPMGEAIATAPSGPSIPDSGRLIIKDIIAEFIIWCGLLCLKITRFVIAVVSAENAVINDMTKIVL